MINDASTESIEPLKRQAPLLMRHERRCKSVRWRTPAANPGPNITPATNSIHGGLDFDWRIPKFLTRASPKCESASATPVERKANTGREPALSLQGASSGFNRTEKTPRTLWRPNKKSVLLNQNSLHEPIVESTKKPSLL